MHATLELAPDLGEPVDVQITATVDPDGDNDGATHPLAGGNDCDDTDPAIHPGATEIWYDGIDQNCDGRDDDADDDGFDLADDCDDNNARIYPGAFDKVDGIDEDCDGVMDEDGAGPGTALISELFVETSAKTGIWDPTFEVYLKNGAGIEGWSLTTDGGTGTMSVLDGATGPWMLLCSAPDAELDPACDAVVDPWPVAARANDVLILSVLGVEVDRVAWNGAWGLISGELQLDRSAAEGTDPAINDATRAWCPNLPSPGEENSSCP